MTLPKSAVVRPLNPAAEPSDALADALVGVLADDFRPEALAQVLGLAPDQVPARIWEDGLYGPAREFLARPGKQFRARLVDMAFRLAGGGVRPMPRELPLVVEVLHAGSLVIDDIEDGSDIRRGGPALHQMVGLPIALNTGNWMYYWATSLLHRAGLAPVTELAIARDVQTTLLRCHHGQALDLAVSVGNLRREEVPGVVAATTRLKTGALLELAARLGGRAAEAPDPVVDALGHFGRTLGEGLQMLDDLGSIASAARLEKGDEDLRQGRPTWPWAWLAETSDDDMWRAMLALQIDLERGGPAAARARVEALAGELTARVEPLGRARVHAHLTAALTVLRNQFGPSRVLTAVEHEIARLEASYG